MIDAYLEKLPEERRRVIAKMRALVRKNLPKGYQSCLRFKALEDVPLDAIGKVIAALPPAKYIANYEKIKG